MSMADLGLCQLIEELRHQVVVNAGQRLPEERGVQGGYGDISLLHSPDIGGGIGTILGLLADQPVVLPHAVMPLLHGVDVSLVGWQGYSYPFNPGQRQVGQIDVKKEVNRQGFAPFVPAAPLIWQRFPGSNFLKLPLRELSPAGHADSPAWQQPQFQR